MAGAEAWARSESLQVGLGPAALRQAAESLNEILRDTARHAISKVE